MGRSSVRQQKRTDLASARHAFALALAFHFRASLLPSFVPSPSLHVLLLLPAPASLAAIAFATDADWACAKGRYLLLASPLPPPGSIIFITRILFAVDEDLDCSRQNPNFLKIKCDLLATLLSPAAQNRQRTAPPRGLRSTC